MKFSLGRTVAITATALAVALSMGPASTAEAKPKVKGTASVSSEPLEWIGSALGNDVTTQAAFKLDGKWYIAVGGDITGYRKGNVTHKSDKLFIIDEEGNFIWGASSIQGGYLQKVQSVSTEAGALATLYMGGTFTSVNGQARGHVAAFNVRSVGGKLQVGLSSTWKPQISGNVRGITYGAGRVYLAASAVTAVEPNNGTQLWSTPFECGAIAIIYANKSVYAGGFSRKAGGVKSKGAFKLSPSSGKVDKKFKPSIAPNKDQCGSGKGAYSGSNPLDFAWDAVNKRLIEADGGIKNYVRSLNPRTGKLIWAHRMDGDAQVALMVTKKELFVGFHRGSANTGRYRYNKGDGGMILNAKSGVQKRWQPSPDFVHGGANNDHRNNGVITAVVAGDTWFVGGGFTQGNQRNLAGYRIKR